MTQKIINYIKHKNLIFMPDAFFNSFWLGKFINKFMKQGKKFIVEKDMVQAFLQFKMIYKTKNGFMVFLQYLLSNRPLLGFSKVRKSRKFKQVPIALTPRRQLIVILHWYVRAIKTYKTGFLQQRIYNELIHIQKKVRTALSQYKENEEISYNLVQNRMNSRFRWK